MFILTDHPSLGFCEAATSLKNGQTIHVFIVFTEECGSSVFFFRSGGGPVCVCVCIREPLISFVLVHNDRRTTKK